MSEITILLLYLIAAAAFGGSRLPRFAKHRGMAVAIAFVAVIVGIGLHINHLIALILIGDGFNLSVGNTVSMIGFELAVIALLAALDRTLRGISAGLLILAGLAAVVTGFEVAPTDATPLLGQVRAHVLISLLSYGLLSGGAIVAVYAMLQERRLQAGKLSPSSALFAPLETTEKLLFGITAAGFAGLSLAILSGFGFVENLFAQHLIHKTTFSLLALVVFGALLLGRHFAGWRGSRAINLYLGGFLLLFLAYFGARLILEQILGRSWG